MILGRQKSFTKDFCCNLTNGLSNLLIYRSDLYFVYIYGFTIERDYYNDKCLALRVPGTTIGHIDIDDNHIITDVVIYKEKTGLFTSNPIEYVKKFIGEELELKL